MCFKFEQKLKKKIRTGKNRKMAKKIVEIEKNPKIKKKLLEVKIHITKIKKLN